MFHSHICDVYFLATSNLQHIYANNHLIKPNVISLNVTTYGVVDDFDSQEAHVAQYLGARCQVKVHSITPHAIVKQTNTFEDNAIGELRSNCNNIDNAYMSSQKDLSN
ncbi:hypothetical protein DPMN_051407 [Dreissena polymorpha]|uniref:Uncharacterized protein n=1 Tax=Dreissena polymorpha TaxID=45954 RepID=A0A9D4HM40_DREPO|nr:hypothetical protein DPMN_051407 [Dreissena polymorpha]